MGRFRAAATSVPGAPRPRGSSSPTTSLQDVFLRVVKHLDSLRLDRRPEAWLFQIARNALRDALRARQRKDGRTDPLDVDVPAEADRPLCATRRRSSRLPDTDDRALAEPYRTAIELTSLRGLTQARRRATLAFRYRV